MITMKNFTSPDAAPEHLREYARKVHDLAVSLAGMLQSTGETDPALLLDVVLNLYINAGISWGRELECANRMVQIGGQILLRDALLQQAASGADPATPAVVH